MAIYLKSKQFSFYSSILLSVLTVITFGIAICTPPISGSFCEADCISYPYSEAITRFPRDYFWMYPAIVLTMTFLIVFISIQNSAPKTKKLFSQVGLSFAVIASSILIVDYFLQISVIQISLLNNENDGIALLTQYNPHGIFIALEEIAYLLMSLSFLFTAFVFSKNTFPGRIIRLILLISFFLTIGSLIFISAKFGIRKGYILEVIIISINWLTFIILGIFLSIYFKKLKIKE